MSPALRRARRLLGATAALLVLHVALVHGLDAVGLVEALLSPGGVRAFVALPMALALFAIRFALLFVLPGLVASALLLAGYEALGARTGGARAGKDDARAAAE